MTRKLAFVVVWIVVAVVATSGAANAADSAARTLPRVTSIGPDNTGVADTGPAPQTPQLDPAKAAGQQAARQQLDALAAGKAGPDSCSPNCPPSSHTLTISHFFYEGEGNGGATYTCGPASTRNLVVNMMGHDYGEHQFAVWEDTSSSTGTAIGNISGALNSHFGSYGSWSVHAPTSSSDLLSDVVADTWAASYQQMTIMNVDTYYLPFWNSYTAKHYDTDYGYDEPNADVYIAEEWDHTVNGAAAPYGYHKTAASTDYLAVHRSPTAEIVW